MADVRAFTQRGIEVFSAWLADLREGAAGEFDISVLQHPDLTRSLATTAVIEVNTFSNRYALAAHLDQALGPSLSVEDFKDAGLWSWLAAFYFDQLCPKGEDGARAPGKDYRYVPSADYRHYYRHLILGPLQVYRRHHEKSLLLLSAAPSSPGDIYEQLASRQDVIASDGIIDAARLLYYSDELQTPKRGVTTSARKGNLRRFVAILQQLDLTYDLQSMTGVEILDLLPHEFNGWTAAKRQASGRSHARHEPVTTD